MDRTDINTNIIFMNKEIKAKVDIVIVNWNTSNLLEECINSIKESCIDMVESIIIIDNNSSDSSATRINNDYDMNLNIIVEKQNHGFVKSCNLGAKCSNADYILFLNPDARVDKFTIQELVAFMEKKESQNIGICGPQLHNDKRVEKTCSRFPSLFNQVVELFGLYFFLPNLGEKMRDFSHLESKVVDQIIGAFFLIRKPLFDELNGFDERFFLYTEEIDLSYRSNKLGYKSYFYHKAQAFHKGGGSSDNIKSTRLFYRTRSRLQYASKNFNKISSTLSIFLVVLIEPVCRILFSLLKLSINQAKETLVAYKMFYIWLFKSVFKK